MSIIGRLNAARFLLEDGFGSLASRASSVVKALTPQLTSSIDIQRMSEPPRRGISQTLTAYSHSPWLQASTKKIAERFATVEWQLFAQVGAGGDVLSLTDERCAVPTIQRAYSAERERWISELKQLGEIKQIHRHPLLDLLANANPAMTGYSARLLTQVHRDIAGEAFWVLSRNFAGKPDQFWPVPPTWVTAMPTEKTPAYTITIGGQSFKVQADDVLDPRLLDRLSRLDNP